MLARAPLALSFLLLRNPIRSRGLSLLLDYTALLATEPLLESRRKERRKGRLAEFARCRSKFQTALQPNSKPFLLPTLSNPHLRDQQHITPRRQLSMAPSSSSKPPFTRKAPHQAGGGSRPSSSAGGPSARPGAGGAGGQERKRGFRVGPQNAPKDAYLGKGPFNSLSPHSACTRGKGKVPDTANPPCSLPSLHLLHLPTSSSSYALPHMERWNETLHWPTHPSVTSSVTTRPKPTPPLLLPSSTSPLHPPVGLTQPRRSKPP